MKKWTSFAILSLVFAFVFLAFSPCLMSESASSDKLSELGTGDSPVEHNTLAAPLFLADFNTVGFAGTHSLLREQFTPGTKGDILFQQLADGGIRLRYRALKEEASFFWLFEKGMDLRNRWLRVRYSGLQVPRRVALEFDKGKSRNGSKFLVYLEDTLVGEEIFFKLPDGISFSNVETIRLVINPEDILRQNGDFVIRDLELLPEGKNPLAGPPTDLKRFDWYAQPFEPENQASFNTHQSF